MPSSSIGFEIEKNTFNEIFNVEIQKTIGSVSLERFRDEFEKILRSPKPSHGLRLMEQTGVLKIFIPELAECRGVEQAEIAGRGIERAVDLVFGVGVLIPPGRIELQGGHFVQIEHEMMYSVEVREKILEAARKFFSDKKFGEEHIAPTARQ